MPPPRKISRNEIISAARRLIRERGPEGLNARDLGASLGLSARPIYSHFASMDELRDHIVDEILSEYFAFLTQDQGTGGRLLDVGLAEVRYARTHPAEYRILKYPLAFQGRKSEGRSPLEALLDHLVEGHGSNHRGHDREHMRETLLPLAIFTHGLADLLSRGFRPDMVDSDVIDLLRTYGSALIKAAPGISDEGSL